LDITVDGSALQAVPEQLKRLPGWMTSGGGADGKAPTDAKGRPVGRMKPGLWRTFEAVAEADHERGCGIGWVVQIGHVVLDLDNAVDDGGDLRPQFVRLVDGMDTYVEWSVSGRGLHIFAESSEAPEKQKDYYSFPDGSKAEVLGPGHFVRITGKLYDGKPSTLKDCSKNVRIVLQKIREAKGERVERQALAEHLDRTSPMPDDEVLELARRSKKHGDVFVALYDKSDTSLYGGDESGADQALANRLAFYTQDPEQLDGLFRRSRLMRPKWDEVHHADGRTYGQGTIDKAIAGLYDTYTLTAGNEKPEEMDRPRGLKGRRMVGEAITEGVEPPPMLLDGFLYEAKLHSWTGEAGHGKSILALWASLQVMQAGMPVLYIDEEGSLAHVSGRLKGMGAEPMLLDQLFYYFQSPGLTLEDHSLAALMETVEDVKPALVVFDSWVDFLALNGLSENDSVDVTRWVKYTAYPVRDAGATVLLLDHVNKESSGRGGRGSTAKLAKLDASFRLTQTKEFDRDTTGGISLKREKDREAALPRVSNIVMGGDGSGKLHVRPDVSGVIEIVEDDRLTDNDRMVLVVLPSTGLRYGEWKKATGMRSESGFNKSRDKLVRLGMISKNENGAYVPHSDTPLHSQSIRVEQPGALHSTPHPLRGGVEECQGGEEDRSAA
jgi:hypothetical protein